VAHYDDLSPCDYFRLADTSRLLAIGWLERGHAFARGDVDREVMRRLVALAKDPWEPFVFLGWHDCDLCPEPEGPATFDFEGQRVAVGTSNLFIPGPRGVFVAPSLVLHTIDAHGYRPPQAFVDAVIACPPMGSAPYLAALRAAGGDGLTTVRP